MSFEAIMSDLQQLFDGRIKGSVVYGADIEQKYLTDFVGAHVGFADAYIKVLDENDVQTAHGKIIISDNGGKIRRTDSYFRNTLCGNLICIIFFQLKRQGGIVFDIKKLKCIFPVDFVNGYFVFGVQGIAAE